MPHRRNKDSRRTDPKAVKQTFYVIWVNCDCASFWWARSSPVAKGALGPRCQYCHRILGFMDWRDYGHVRAESAEEAIQLARVRGEI